MRRYRHGKHEDVRVIKGTKDEVSAAFVAQFGSLARKSPGKSNAQGETKG